MANGIPTAREYSRIRNDVPQEIKDISRDIVKRSKSTAHVDTGRLKRSINWVIDYDGIPTFTEVFYGQFHDNSELLDNIKEMMPAGQAWKLIYTDDNGQPYQVIRKMRSGRAAVTNATKKTTPKSLGIAGIKNFIKKLTDGKKKDEGTDSSGSDNQG